MTHQRLQHTGGLALLVLGILSIGACGRPEGPQLPPGPYPVAAFAARPTEPVGPFATVAPTEVRAAGPLRGGEGEDELPGTLGSSIGNATVGEGRWYGVPLCTSGGTAVVLDAVEPYATVGTGAVAATPYLLDSAAPVGISSTDPSRGQAVRPAVGGELARACKSPGSRQAQLVIGLRKTSRDGGGWEGAVITYHDRATGKQLRQYVRGEMLLCGTSAPLGEVMPNDPVPTECRTVTTP